MITVVAKVKTMAATALINANKVAENSFRRDKGLQYDRTQNVLEVDAPPASPINEHTTTAAMANNEAKVDVIFA